MKKIFFLIIMLSVVGAFAQTPQSFKYQTVVRNNEGKALANTLIGLRISILFGSPLGIAVYVETFQHATNEFGIASINIGKGTTKQGVFAAINWAAGEYFIKTEVDITGATNYDYIGTSQLLSVPYALYAEKSGKSINDQDTSATNELQNITKTGNTIMLSQGGGSITDSDNQTINLNGFNLSISNGNTIQLPPDVDHDTINEIQLITKSGNIISLSKNGGSVTDSDNQSLTVVNNQLTITNGNTINIDQDTLNEIQTISKIGSTVTLSKNGGSLTDSDNQTISLTGNQLTLSNGNTIVLSGAVDLDSDPTNEIQQLHLSNDTLRISQSNEVILLHDADRDSTNEIQYLLFSNDTIYLSKGNNVKLPYIPIQNNGIPVGFESVCNLQNEGKLRYHSTTKKMQFCNGIEWVELNQTFADTFLVTTSYLHVTETGGNDGAISINISGGLVPYVVNWSNGQHSLLLNNLSAGMYTVTVIDANLTTIIKSIDILEPQSVIDIDGNSYNSIYINNVCWFKENLNVSRKPDGTNITKKCYDDNSANCSIYGGLYDLTTALQICPTGWHLATESDWTNLINNLGGDSVAGGKMKDIGTTYWNSPNTGASNSSKFSALPGGQKVLSPPNPQPYIYLQQFAFFIDTIGNEYNLHYSNDNITKATPYNETHFSVRCVKN